MQCIGKPFSCVEETVRSEFRSIVCWFAILLTENQKANGVKCYCRYFTT